MEASQAFGTVHIKRERRFMGNVWPFRVFIDGREVGKLRNGEEAEYSAPPGTREVSIKMGVVSSKRMTVEVQAGKTTHLVCMCVWAGITSTIDVYQLAPPSQPSVVPSSRSSSEITRFEELEKLADLRDKGIITEEEFNAKKEQLLGL
jgi:Short C-terminal domain